MAIALDAVEILRHLVAFPTVSRDTNLPLVDWVRSYLEGHGVRSHLIRDVSGEKSNLFASVGPPEVGGLVLSGHTDVVPVDGQIWSSDPFVLTQRGSRMHARGACDMKGFIAVALSRIPVWKAMRLARPLHLMLSYDEEIGCLGAPSMIAAAQAKLPRPAAVIVGEPTQMRVANEHKGICTARTLVRGVEAHSSLTHQGVSAVMLAAELIVHLDELARERASGGGSPARARRFEPPQTTCSINRIEGGTATNILAAACEFGWEIRVLPGETPSSILEHLSVFAKKRLEELSKAGKTCHVETRVESEVPPLESDSGPAEALAHAAAQRALEAITVPFATEAGQFQHAGWSAVVCGPGSIEQAHKPDEFVERSEIAACEVFLDRAVALQCR